MKALYLPAVGLEAGPATRRNKDKSTCVLRIGTQREDTTELRVLKTYYGTGHSTVGDIITPLP